MGEELSDGRLRRRKDFQLAYREGRRFPGRLLNVFAIANGLRETRIGITVTRKSGGAVQRNRLRRQIREIIRDARASGRGRDLVIHVKPGVRLCEYRDLDLDLGILIRRALAGLPPAPRPRPTP